MSDIKKFMFDANDFTNITSTADIVTYTEEQLLLAKKQSFNAGKTEGVAETKQQQEEFIGKLLQQSLTSIDNLSKEEDRREIEKSIDAVRLTTRIIEKILPSMAEEHAIKDIETTIVESIKARKDEPRIIIKVAPQHLEAIQNRTKDIINEKDLHGKVTIEAEEGISPTDCKIEWGDGGAERLYEDLLAKIEKELNTTMAGLKQNIEGITGEPYPEEPEQPPEEEIKETEQQTEEQE